MWRQAVRPPQEDGSSGNEELAESIQAFVKQCVAPFKYPRVIEFIDDLPKTATGKIQRFKLREGQKAGQSSNGAETR